MALRAMQSQLSADPAEAGTMCLRPDTSKQPSIGMKNAPAIGRCVMGKAGSRGAYSAARDERFRILRCCSTI
jgi:hypothetical protein